MTTQLRDKKFVPHQFQYRVSNEYGEFSYYWAFCAYEAGEKFVKLVLNIDLEGFTEDSLADFESYADYPELADVLEKIVKDYKGFILPDNSAAFGFAFSKKNDMLNFITDVSQRMEIHGITPFDGLDRCSAFPSIEYGTDMLSYVLGEDCSLIEVEMHMVKSANMTGRYEEICGFREIPCKTEQKFCPQKDADLTQFFKEWDEYLQEFQKTHEESCMPTKLNKDLKRLQENNKPNVNTTEEVSSAYTSFASMWM